MTADEIVAAARAQVGTPFRHQGRRPGEALDCVGLGAVVAGRWHDVLEPAAYGRMPERGLLLQWIERQPFLHRVEAMQPGDALLMRFGREPQHMAIYAGKTIIHSYAKVGRVVEHNLDETWRRRIVAVYRFDGVTA